MENQSQTAPESDTKIVPDEARTLLRKIVADRDRDALWEWIKEFLHTEIPRKAICEHHCAPFDFFADYILGEIKDGIVLANRSGGKTMGFGILDTIMSYLSDDTEVAAVGAIQFQAQKGYEYFDQFSSLFPFASNIKTKTMKKTYCHNGSTVQILTGTMSGVNSPHPQILFLDEIDLMAWQVLQQALSMPQSKHGVESRTILTSTRKFGAGPMQRLLDDAVRRKYKVYQWCIWEVVEKLPSDPEKLAEIKEEFKALPARIGDADGYYTWSDTISKHNTLDEETWETEWECSKPGMEGIIYGSSFSDDNNVLPDWTPYLKDGTLKRGYFYLLEDCGFGEGHPDVLLLTWVPPEFDRMIVFDERYMTNYGDDQVWEEMEAMLASWGLSLRKHIRGWSVDPHAISEIAFRKRKGAPVMEQHKDAARYIVWNGIKMVKRLMQTGRFMQSSKCVNLRLEWMSYKKKKNLDGTYSMVIVKKEDHGPDAARYWIVKMFDLIIKNAFENKDRQEAPAEQLYKPELSQNAPPPPLSQKSETVTGSMSRDLGIDL